MFIDRAAGRKTVAAVPWPTAQSSSTRPPCNSTARFTIASPSPLPSASRLRDLSAIKKRSKTRLRSSSAASRLQALHLSAGPEDDGQEAQDDPARDPGRLQPLRRARIGTRSFRVWRIDSRRRSCATEFRRRSTATTARRSPPTIWRGFAEARIRLVHSRPYRPMGSGKVFLRAIARSCRRGSALFGGVIYGKAENHSCIPSCHFRCLLLLRAYSRFLWKTHKELSI